MPYRTRFAIAALFSQNQYSASRGKIRFSALTEKTCTAFRSIWSTSYKIHPNREI